MKKLREVDAHNYCLVQKPMTRKDWIMRNLGDLIKIRV